MNSLDLQAPPPAAAPIDDRYEFGKTGSGRPFHKLCVDLDRAWAMCRLTSYERRVLQYVREYTWGVSAPRKAEAIPCPIPSAALAEAWRVPRQRVGEAVSSLADDGMLIRVGDNFLIGKNVFSWGEGRIDPQDIEYCIVGAAETIASIKAGKARDESKTGTEKCADRHGKTCGTEKRAARKNVRTCTENRAEIDDSARFSVPPHIRNAPASEDFQKTEEETTTTLPMVLSGRGTFQAYDPDEWTPRSDDVSGEIVAPVELPPAVLVDDELGGKAAPPPSRPASGDDREYDEFRDWAKDLVYETTQNIDQAEAVWKRIAIWRGWEISQEVIGAFLEETCLVKYEKLSKKDVPSYVHAIMKNYLDNPNQKVPPTPARWRRKPQPAPKIYRPSQDPMAIQEQQAREAFQLAKQEAKRVSAAERDEADARVEELRRRMLAVMDARAARDRSAAPMGVAR